MIISVFAQHDCLKVGNQKDLNWSLALAAVQSPLLTGETNPESVNKR